MTRDRSGVPDEVHRPELFEAVAGELHEVDQAFEMSPLWEVRQVVHQVVAAYQRGELDPESALRALDALVVTDDTGTRWSMGATTLRWWAQVPPGPWVLAKHPPQPTASLRQQTSEALERSLAVLGLDPSVAKDEARPPVVTQTPTTTSTSTARPENLLSSILGDTEG